MCHSQRKVWCPSTDDTKQPRVSSFPRMFMKFYLQDINISQGKPKISILGLGVEIHTMHPPSISHIRLGESKSRAFFMLPRTEAIECCSRPSLIFFFSRIGNNSSLGQRNEHSIQCGVRICHVIINKYHRPRTWGGMRNGRSHQAPA